MDVHGLQLPETLAAALTSGTWTTPVAASVLAAIFPDEPSAPFRPRFYSFDEMWGMSNPLQAVHPAYLGVAPDDMDPAHWVWIGELALDRPFALDFRSDPPIVRFLTVPGHWIPIAPSVDDLLIRLGKT